MKNLFLIVLLSSTTQFPWSPNQQGDGSSPWSCAQGSGPCGNTPNQGSGNSPWPCSQGSGPC